MILVDKNTKVVIDIVNSAQVVENGILVQKPNGDVLVYGMKDDLDIIDVTAPDGVEAQKYKYTNGAFEVNPDYIAPEIV